jgi:hypothetical protein
MARRPLTVLPPANTPATLLDPRGQHAISAYPLPPRECITMLQKAQTTKIDPIFAVIEAHRQATAARYPILETMMATKDSAAERRVIEASHDKAADIEVAATVKLRKTRPTTVAGVMAVAAYFVEHKDRYPHWIGGDVQSKPGSLYYPEPVTFEDSLIRNLAAALEKMPLS